MRSLEDQVREAVTPLLTGLGFVLVDLNVFRSRGWKSVKLVIYREPGVGIEDCASVSRQIHPRLLLFEELADCSLEVSSPGIGRLLKSPAEYDIFKGRGAAVLLAEESEWRKGLIDHTDQQSLFLRSGGEITALSLEKIKRVKLVFIEGEDHKHVL